MKSKTYAGVSFFIMILAFILAKSSISIFAEFFGNILGTLFPFWDVWNMANNTDASTCYIYLLICDWIAVFMAFICEDESDNWIFLWLGDTFMVMFFAIINYSKSYMEQTENVMGYLFWAVMLLYCIYIFFKDLLKQGSVLGIFKSVFSFCFYGFIITCLRLVFPLIIVGIFICVICMIPITFTQDLGCIIAVALMFFIKMFTDTLVDKLDGDGTVKTIRFVLAMIIIIGDFWIITGHHIN